MSLNGEIHSPALNDKGDNYEFNKPGARSERFNFFVSSKIRRSHLKKYWPLDIPLHEKKDAIKAGVIEKKCNDFYHTQVRPFSLKGHEDLGLTHDAFETEKLTLFKRMNEICEEGYILQDKYPNRKLKMGSSVYLRANMTGNELAEIIAHELMHTWGGLADRYKGLPKERERWSENLMGIKLSCVLTDNQISSIIKFRNTGEEEVWPK